MKMTEDDKRLLGLSKQLESQRCKSDLIAYAEAMVRAQKALKEDYGLVGPDATLFNGLAAPGPVYARRGFAPMGAALAMEAVNA